MSTIVEFKTPFSEYRKRSKKSTEIIVISLDIFVFCAILVHVNQIPEAAPGFFQTAITTFSIGFINNMVRRPIK